VAEPPDIQPEPSEEEPEVVEGEVAAPLPVLAEPRTLERRPAITVPAAIAAATGGFLLGVATFVLVRILRRPRPVRRAIGKRGRRSGQIDIAATRSFLVDVHLLDRR
jgi:hypothetical protein